MWSSSLEQGLSFLRQRQMHVRVEIEEEIAVSSWAIALEVHREKVGLPIVKLYVRLSCDEWFPVTANHLLLPSPHLGHLPQSKTGRYLATERHP